jgi:hypothetical protein
LVHRGVKVPLAPTEPGVPFPPFAGTYPLEFHLVPVDGAPLGAVPPAAPVPAAHGGDGGPDDEIWPPFAPLPAGPVTRSTFTRVSVEPVANMAIELSDELGPWVGPSHSTLSSLTFVTFVAVTAGLVGDVTTACPVPIAHVPPVHVKYPNIDTALSRASASEYASAHAYTRLPALPAALIAAWRDLRGAARVPAFPSLPSEADTKMPYVSLISQGSCVGRSEFG